MGLKNYLMQTNPVQILYVNTSNQNKCDEINLFIFKRTMKHLHIKKKLYNTLPIL